MARSNGKPVGADHQLTRLVKASASQVLEVGRGARSLAESEGSRLVGGLLGIGARLDRGAKSRVFEARSSAADTWHRLENAFVNRVARALNALQIPTARDVHELSNRVAALQKAVVALERRAAETAAAQSHEASGAVRAPGKKRIARTTRRAPAGARKKTRT